MQIKVTSKSESLPTQEQDYGIEQCQHCEFVGFRGGVPMTLGCHVASQKNRDLAARTFKNKKYRLKRGKLWDLF
jgi:hypothetical protein